MDVPLLCRGCPPFVPEKEDAHVLLFGGESTVHGHQSGGIGQQVGLAAGDADAGGPAASGSGDDLELSEFEEGSDVAAGLALGEAGLAGEGGEAWPGDAVGIGVVADGEQHE